MKEIKKQRRKAIPHCYRRAKSRSNSSLSQLVHIGSYKKRINDLSRNNRLLAVALQESRVEAALQSNLLKDYARDGNQILFARLKLNEMAKNMAKFVTDLEEVRNYLNIDFPTNNTFPQKNGSPSERIIRIPTVNCIEEVSVLSSETEISAVENPEVPETSSMSSQKPDDKISCDVQPSTSGSITDSTNDVEMAPILFVGDNEGKKRSSSRIKRSKIPSDADKGSLTPELDIDLTCLKRKRTSSRRMTQFNFPDTRITRSRGKTTSSEKKISTEELVTPVRPTSPPLMHEEQDPVKENRIEEEISISPSTENIKQIGKIISSSSQDVMSVNDQVSSNNPPDVPSACLPLSVETAVPPGILEVPSNHTVLLCEDMELTEVVRPVHQIIVENSLPTAVKPQGNPDINADIPKENKEQDTRNKEVSSEAESHKLSDCPQDTSMISDNRQLREIKDAEYDEEIQNVGTLTFCEPNEGDENIKMNESFNDTFSPLVKRSRSKKSVKYAVFFSSDESDEGSSFERVLNKGKGIKKQKVTTTLKPESSEKTSEVIKKCCSVQKISSKVANNASKNDHSVYNLDVSNSEKQGDNREKKKLLQKSKISKGRKAVRKKDLPKPLFQNCSVTKLKSGNYKFSKNETPKKLKAVNGQVKKYSVIGVSPSISPGGILKKAQFDLSEASVEKEKETILNTGECVDDIEDNKLSSSIIHLKLRDVLETPKSESKRVSFASTDLVCNFRGMSVSKKIADNKKVRRGSKSVLDFEIIEEMAQTKAASCQDTDISSESIAAERVNQAALFNFSADTEVYTFTFPSNTRFPTFPTDDLLASSKPTISTVAGQTINTDNSIKIQHSQKLHLTSKSPKQTGKLSLKRNKSSLKAVSTCISDKMEKETNVLLLESPKSVVTKARRKSLFKQSSPDDLKENTISDHCTSEKPEGVLQIKPRVAINSSLSNECNKKSLVIDKRQSKINSKISLKRNNLSDKHKVLQPTSEVKCKKSGLLTKPLEDSPVLKDVLNLIEDEKLPKRRSKIVNYREPNLIKKLRRN